MTRFALLITGLLLLFAFFLQPSTAQAQENYRRHSITINAGMATASGDLSGNQISPLGYYGSGLDRSLSLGGSYMYGVHPTFSFQLAGQYVQFSPSAANAEKREITFVSMKGLLHLNQLLGARIFTQRLAPYISLGFGINVKDFDSRLGWHINGGPGLSFLISRGVDFFAQYEMNLANRMVNPVAEDLPTFGQTTAGLRFHLGSGSSRHTSWRRPTRDFFEEDYQRLVALDSRMEQVESNDDRQDRDVQRLEQRLDSRTQQLDNRIRSLENTTSDLASDLADMKQSIAENSSSGSGTETAAGSTNDGMMMISGDSAGEASGPYTDAIPVSDLPDGYYLQIFASDSMENARRVRQDVIDLLGGSMPDTPEMVLITQRSSFYLVYVGLFSQFNDSASFLRLTQEEYDDAFIIRFPRPAEQEDLY